MSIPKKRTREMEDSWEEILIHCPTSKSLIESFSDELDVTRGGKLLLQVLIDQNRELDLLQQLIDNGLDVMDVTIHGMNVLEYASVKRNYEYFIELAAEIGQGRTLDPLYYYFESYCLLLARWTHLNGAQIKDAILKRGIEIHEKVLEDHYREQYGFVMNQLKAKFIPKLKNEMLKELMQQQQQQPIGDDV
jgi:hypothetical protein